MAKLEENSADARTFAEIYSAFAEDERIAFQHEIRKKTHCSDQSVRNWGRGLRRPVSYYQRRAVADVLEKFTGHKHMTDVLFK